jgi:hypothetical protein
MMVRLCLSTSVFPLSPSVDIAQAALLLNTSIADVLPVTDHVALIPLSHRRHSLLAGMLPAEGPLSL